MCVILERCATACGLQFILHLKCRATAFSQLLTMARDAQTDIPAAKRTHLIQDAFSAADASERPHLGSSPYRTHGYYAVNGFSPF